MKKRIIGLFLALVALCFAAQAEETSPWSYDNLNYYVCREVDLRGDVTIPAEVDGYPANAIENNAFYEQHEITSLTLPDTLRALQDGAVSYMDGLTGVTLNDGLEFIGSNFGNCPALTSLTIPASVRMVDGIVSNCENLREIRFEGPCPLFLNAQWCFFMMPDDYTIYVPDDQLDAYAAALAEANGAADHLQPSGGNAPAREAANTEDWFAFEPATGTITGYKEYHAWVEFPETIGGVPVKAVGEGAFRSDYTLCGVVLPEGLETIEAGAFQYASNIGYVSFPSSLKTIGDDAFFNVQADRIDWSEGLETIGARAFQYDCEPTLTLPTTLKTIGEGAFERASCQELALGGSVETIGARAFADTPLNYMAFDLYAPIDIAADAFVETQLADLDLPWDSSLENRDAYAALLKDQCPDCTVWINNPGDDVAQKPTNEIDITTIQDGVWTVYNGDQSDLTVWTNYDGVAVTALGDGVFKGNQTIRSFYPHHCGWFTTIGAEAFADSSVEYVEMFPSIAEIGDEAFRNCENLTELTLPDSLTTLGAGALRGCTGLTELTLPASLTSIGEGALDGCDRLAKLTVLCDPAILPEDLLADCLDRTEILASPDATQEQVATLSALAQRPWYAPVSRVGEPARELIQMPYAELPVDDFWYDTDYARLDAYQGYELNLYLPREAEGAPLTLIGGNMMSRACYGDNFDVELPVRSLVIPETYREIAAYAFSNCETLETVVCYAPLETLPEGCFSGCTRLREVVFVNGVRNVAPYVFDNCPSLETVYLGEFVDQVSEYAFLNIDGGEAFSSCLTDPAQLPDVDALLAAVKSDPMPAPTPEPTPEPAQPVGPEGEPYFGTWTAMTIEMEGMRMNLADMGMAMTLTLNEDGTATLSDGEETEATVWTLEDGLVTVDTMSGTLQSDGTLCLEEEGVKLIFARGEAVQPEITPEPAAPVTGDMSDYVGTWTAMTIEMEGMRMNLADMGMAMTLTLNADGTATLSDGEESESTVWTLEDGLVTIDTMSGTLQSDGTLCLEEEGVKLTFARGEAEPADQDPGQRLEWKYVMVGAEVQGVSVTPDMLGGLEYSLTFHADGTVDFTMAGTPVPGLGWSEDGDTWIIDYYGMPLNVVLTDEGFDMNYFDSMLIHFAPEA